MYRLHKSSKAFSVLAYVLRPNFGNLRRLVMYPITQGIKDLSEYADLIFVFPLIHEMNESMKQVVNIMDRGPRTSHDLVLRLMNC